MIKNINKDIIILKRKSVDADIIKDKQVAMDLLDTLKSESERCVGMAANMIGVNKNIIAFVDKGKYIVMFNPVIVKTSKETYTVKEGCLCHTGEKETLRYKKIKVSYMDFSGIKKLKTYDGFTAQIIQHELDHLNGILI